MHFQLTRIIHAPVARVFDFFADPRLRPRWQRTLTKVEILTPGGPQKGMRWQEWPTGLGKVTLEITEFERPQCWAEMGTSALGQLRLRLTTTAEGSEQTRLFLEANLEVPRLLRWGATLAKPLMLREFRNDVARAAHILETS